MHLLRCARQLKTQSECEECIGGGVGRAGAAYPPAAPQFRTPSEMGKKIKRKSVSLQICESRGLFS